MGTAIAPWKPQELTSRVEGKIPQIESLLPDQLRGKGDWFVKRAMLELTTSKNAYNLKQCTGDSIIMAVIKGAELGIPIDGKLGYFVPYRDKAEFQASYLGLLTVARRSGQIKDAYVGMVYSNDHFDHGRTGITCKLEHTWKPGQPRGEQLAAYAVVEFPDGGWTYELMEMGELEAIRNRSKAKSNGPWVTDTDQMFLKTVLRRALKRYCSDPGFIMAVQHDEQEFAGESNGSRRPLRSSVTDMLMPRVDQQLHDEPSQPEAIDEPTKDDPTAVVAEIIEQIMEAVERNDVPRINQLYRDHCGPDSTLETTQRAIIEQTVKQAREELKQPVQQSLT